MGPSPIAPSSREMLTLQAAQTPADPNAILISTEDGANVPQETKEERRQRKQERRKKKEEKRQRKEEKRAIKEAARLARLDSQSESSSVIPVPSPKGS